MLQLTQNRVWSSCTRVISAPSLRLQLRFSSTPEKPAAEPVQKKRLHFGDLEKRTFYDKTRLKVRGGNGGSGCSSYERMTQSGGKGPPNGADGGQGGNIYFETTTQLEAFRFDRNTYNGGHGKRGGSDNAVGSSGADAIVNVPVGTMVREVVGRCLDTGRVKLEEIADLDAPNQRVLVAEGGIAGRGNKAFKTTYRSTSAWSTAGGPGQKRELVLELKLLADVGLVGYPNAGKSSLLGAISKATPKVASYPFTTLKPSLGMVEIDPDKMEYMSVADIPGLIEGAHMNVGLGHDFLRHIERTKVLLYVLDAAGTEGRDPLEDFAALRRELELYNPELLSRQALIFCNKQDRKPKTFAKHVARIQEHTPIPIICGSALKKKNLDELVSTLTYMVRMQNSRSDKRALKA